jgi:hypothetical protein
VNITEQARFGAMYARQLRALKLHGIAEKTIDGYASAGRRAAAFFDCCPDDLTAEDPRVYFAQLL